MIVTLMCFNQFILVISNIQKSLGLITDSVVDHTNHSISISKYLAGSSYIKLQKELDYPRKGLIKYWW